MNEIQIKYNELCICKVTKLIKGWKNLNHIFWEGSVKVDDVYTPQFCRLSVPLPRLIS